MTSTAHGVSRVSPVCSGPALFVLGVVLASAPACDSAERYRAADAGTVPDASDAEDARPDEPPDECEEQEDGARCGDGEYCREGRCQNNRCGDGLRVGGESCDDGNQSAGDGCD